jgi:hypothetical protein
MFRLIEVAFVLVFANAVAHHVVRADFRPLAAISVPVLVVFYGFASVLFVRGKALAPGLWQLRSLYAAERTMQATVWYALGLVLGTVLYASLKHLDSGYWLWLYTAPYALMQVGLIFFLRGIWALAPDLFDLGGVMAVARRVRPVA